MSNVMWFESYWEGMKPEVGGKAASLGEMTGAGLPVPPGFTITTEARREYLAQGSAPGALRGQVAMALRQLEASTLSIQARVSPRPR